jgi:hypothetical protein
MFPHLLGWGARSIAKRLDHTASLTRKNIHTVAGKYVPPNCYTMVSLTPANVPLAAHTSRNGARRIRSTRANLLATLRMGHTGHGTHRWAPQLSSA